MAVWFDLFGTVSVDRPTESWVAVADVLAVRDVSVPQDWEAAYRSSHAETLALAERSLVDYTCAAPDVEPASLVHVGDDPRTDGGGRTAGVTAILAGETPLAAVLERLEAVT